jgi:hypothetical protein
VADWLLTSVFSSAFVRSWIAPHQHKPKVICNEFQSYGYHAKCTDNVLVLQGYAGRFAGSYIENYRIAELRSLRTRTLQPAPGMVATCLCIVAKDSASDSVVAAADLLPPESVTGIHPVGVPKVLPLACPFHKNNHGME